ncbi:REP-associated tyrosine transposase [Legionella lansingensis]|uniref:REP-associated tyrosine transposase n=1 Tax=Legionella lansingensis TaxID=45067 RepID=UPI000AAAE6B6
MYRRNFIPGATYFFTVTLRNRKSPLLIEKIDLLRNAIHSVKNEHPFAIKAYVILPDHLHTIWQLPTNDQDYSLRWKKIKTLFSKRVRKSGYILSKSKHNEYDLWQRRFWEHTIRDQQDFENHVNYIHYNPIKHHFVNQLEDWPFSSFHHYVKSNILPANWAESFTNDLLLNLYGE